MADKDGKNKRLGRGLAALIGDSAPEAAAPPEKIVRDTRKVPIEHIEPNPRNPRKTFTEKDLADLAESLKAKGIVQPILVRPAAGKTNRFEIIAGERRWRAAQRAGLHEAPIIIREVTDQEALELAIIENVQRADLNPVEEAMGYEQLTAEFNYSQGELAKVIGKSRSHVANTMRLLKLPNSVKDYLSEGILTAGHARALITLDEETAKVLAELIVEKDLTVRDAEKISQDPVALAKLRGEKVSGDDKPQKDADTKALEKRLTDTLGLKVTVGHKPGKESGDLKIKYTSLEQLDEICKKLGVETR
ncbi:MAG: ParB/RepB/Spo0J family partition protein [Roseibium sp.]|uniref:ParB/RepB/Spo0J family partition protein n=1 Tax=Roseibium sp. TaxID=1936156 RepID=UPI001B12B33C|nr:ParB/RepB/Spo0J family partition protein [Roseibium sp.]MBO6894436.1 ParB/RepB/Spo0J family partition protein [Roseibium sp.]MBO6929621.1 ParB/RepB/Spo0J family partition protein [Roseibium sp.]